MDPWMIVSALAGALSLVAGAAYAGQVLRAKDWKDLYEAEDREHAKTLKWAERLVDQVIELGAKPSRPSSEPPDTTTTTTTSRHR